MGLDVYCYRIDDTENKKRLTERYEAESEAEWNKTGKQYEELTQPEKEAVWAIEKTIALRLGLGEDGEYLGETKIEIDSRLYPEHMYKIGYLRSSYNDSGIDRILWTKIGVTLGTIFGRDDDSEYEFQPDWTGTKDRAIGALEALRAANAKNGKAYRVISASLNMFTKPDEIGVKSTEDAMRVFNEEVARSREVQRDVESSSYSNRNGDFFGRPLTVAALIPGLTHFGIPGVYVVYEEADESRVWYEQALEIVIEFCEYAIEHPDKDKLWLHWSS